MTEKQQNYEWKLAEAELTEIWKPEEAEEKTITGKLIEVRTKVGKNESTLYTFEKLDGTLVSIWGNAVLDARFRNIELGIVCKIEYLGREKSKNDREYKNFNVYTAK